MRNRIRLVKYPARAVTFILIFVLFIIVLVNPDILPISQSESVLDSFVIQGQDSSPVSVRFAITPIQLSEASPQNLLEIKNITYTNSSLPEKASTICVDNLQVVFSGGSRVWSGSESHVFLFDDKICKPIEIEEILPDVKYVFVTLYDKDLDTVALSEPMYLENNPYYYPYDDFDLQAGVFITYSLIDDSGKTVFEEAVIPETLIHAEGGQDWDRTNAKSPYKGFWVDWSSPTLEFNQGTAKIQITEDRYSFLINDSLDEPNIIFFQRPLIIRIIFPIIVFSFVAFIYLLAMVDTLELFFGGSVAVLVGLFGMREVLIPVNFQVKTLVDISILMLYVAFAIATLIQVTSIVPKLYQNNKSDSQQVIKKTNKKINRNP